MEEIKLKRCPCCDSDNLVEGNVITSLGEDLFIRCINCNLILQLCIEHGRDELIQRWNTRTPMENIIKKLEEENNRLKKLKNGFIALSDHEVCDIENAAYNFAINLIKSEM